MTADVGHAAAATDAKALRLTLGGGLITEVHAGAELLPDAADTFLGRPFLELVHPADRELIAPWLANGEGVSPPFRRAAVDDPPRWFRAVTAAGPGAGGPVAIEEVTRSIRIEALTRRTMSLLARERGEELLARGAAAAAQIIGGTHAFLAEAEDGAYRLVSVAGSGLGGGEVELALAGSLVEAALKAGRTLVVNDGLCERYPGDQLLRVIGGRAALVTTVAGDRGDGGGGVVLAVVFPERAALLPEAVELVELLTLRLATELGAVGGGEADRRPRRAASGDRMVTLALIARGITHTFNNLLAAVGLNAQLAQVKAGPESRVAAQLGRIEETVDRGGRLVRHLGILGDPIVAVRAPVDLIPLLEQARRVVHSTSASAEVETSTPEHPVVVWGNDQLVLAILINLLLPLTECTSPGAGVAVDLLPEAIVDGPVRWARIQVRTACSQRLPELSDDVGRLVEQEWGEDNAVSLSLSLVSVLVNEAGGRIALEQSDGPVTVTLDLPRIAPRRGRDEEPSA